MRKSLTILLAAALASLGAGVALCQNFPTIGSLPAAPASSANDVLANVTGTHIGPTTAQSWKNFDAGHPGYWFYLGAGTSGVVREIEYTSMPGPWAVFVTNQQFRVWVDGGNQTDPTNSPQGNLVIDAPLGLMLCNYRCQQEYTIAANTRWLRENFIGSPFDANNIWTVSLTMPMPFTNGILIELVDNVNGLRNDGFTYVSAELGTIPSQLYGYRLRSSTNVFGAYTNGQSITYLNRSGGGELLSVYASFLSNGQDAGFFEGLWKHQNDGMAETAMLCAGGEDFIYNGWYGAFGAQMKYDYGFSHIEFAPVVYFDGYRCLGPNDSITWKSSANLYFKMPPFGGGAFTGGTLYPCILCFYYGK